jgi:hypothetical protein
MQLRFLHVTGPNTEPANVDYVLGAKNPPEAITEQALYDLVHLGVAMDDGTETTFVRALRGGEIRIIEGLVKARPAPKQGTAVSAQHSAKVSLSKILLNQLGASGARVQTRAAGDTRVLSFRDLDDMP